MNPFRYRGYVYDLETGFYYLQSRYYDPETGRFISADGKMAGVGGDLLGYNLFAYCQNDPVNKVEPTGNWPIIFGILFVVAAAVTVVVNVVQIQRSKELVESYDYVEPMSDTEYEKVLENEDTTTLDTVEEQIAYIRALREKDGELAKEWSEAQMLRELRYHNAGYEFLQIFALEDAKMGEQFKLAEFEEKQTAKTYLRRIVGNVLTWLGGE